ECLVEQAVNAALTDAFDAAQALLIERLGSVTLEQLAEDFEARFQGLGLCEGGSTAQ
ncbi:MAG: transcriptional regulator, partial [Pseudomonas helleri]